MKINIGYDTKSIHKAIKQIEKYQKKLQNFIPDFLEACADKVAELANKRLKVFEYDSDIISEIEKSWSKTKSGNSVILLNLSEKATYIEFGVGQVGANRPHDSASEAGYDYDINNRGNKGWGFYLDEGQSLDLRQPYYKEFFKSNKFWIWTNGSPATMFLFNALQDFIDEEMYIDIAKQLLKGYNNGYSGLR